MPRQSKTDRVLDEKEATLKKEHAALIGKLAGIEASLEMLDDMRRRMQALPKRASRAKPRGTAPAPANNQPATATAA